MYNDYNNMYQQYRQPVQQMQPVNPYQIPQKQSNVDWIMVQNVNEVEQIAVHPGQKAWIMVQNEPIFALRSANNMGLVSTEIYKFEKYEKEVAAEPEKNYVTREEMNTAIKSAIKELKDESNNVTN